MKKAKESLSGSSGVGVHMGAILLRAATTYPTLLEVILEQIQNAIDANAHDVWVNINQKSRTLSIRDNGDGATQAKFEEALDTVGRTIKPKDKLGRFGLGLCSPLGKCEKHTFTSTSKGDPRGYIEWTFETPKIAEMKDVKVPLRTRPDMWYGDYNGQGITSVQWRTEVRLEKYTADRFVSRVTMESLCEGIQKYNQSMKQKDVVVHVTLVNHEGDRKTQDVRAENFQGTPLETQVLESRDSGKTHFKLYLAKGTTKGRTGKVWVGETGNDFRITFSMFLRSLPDGTKLSEETVQALNSGVFEGEILNSRVSLHANRRGFEANDALLGYCVAIEEWFQKFGREHFEQIRQTRREERYQGLGVRSMRVIEALIKSPIGEHIMKAIEGFRKGTIGIGHFARKGEDVGQLGIAVVSAKPQTTAKGEGHTNETPTEERKGHKPFVVYGPQGNPRKVVRSSSLGLNLAHEPLPGNKLWEFDATTGTIILNIKHPLWVQCEERGDKVLMKFQEYLMVHALTVQILPDDWQEIARTGLDEATPLYAFTLINGDSLSGRIPTVSTRKADDTKPKALAKKLVLKTQRN